MDLLTETPRNHVQPWQFICVGINLIIIIAIIILAVKISILLDMFTIQIPLLTNALIEQSSLFRHEFISAINQEFNMLNMQIEPISQQAIIAIPNFNSLVLHINSSLPTYTNFVSRINVTEIQYDITQTAELIANLTVLANKIAHFFHIV